MYILLVQVEGPDTKAAQKKVKHVNIDLTVSLCSESLIHLERMEEPENFLRNLYEHHIYVTFLYYYYIVFVVIIIIIIIFFKWYRLLKWKCWMVIRLSIFRDQIYRIERGGVTILLLRSISLEKKVRTFSICKIRVTINRPSLGDRNCILEPKTWKF